MKQKITLDQLAEFLGLESTFGIVSVKAGGKNNDRIVVERFVYYQDSNQKVLTHRGKPIKRKDEIALVK